MAGVARELPPHLERRLAEIREPAIEDPDGRDTNDACCVCGQHEAPSFHPETEGDRGYNPVHGRVDRLDYGPSHVGETPSHQRVRHNRCGVDQKHA